MKPEDIGAIGILVLGSLSMIGTGYGLRSCTERTPRRIPPSFESATLEQCAQSEQVCHAVAERLGIVVTIPPWQAMVLTPVLDPR